MWGTGQRDHRTGRTAVITVAAPRGSSERGIEWSDVAAKYRALLALGDIEPATIEHSLALIHQMDGLEQVGSLTTALTR